VEFWALVGCGRGQWKLGDYDAAAAALHAALAAGERLDNPATAAIALNNLGLVRFFQGQPETAQELHRRALDLQRQSDDRVGIAGSLNNLAMVEYSRQDFDAARELSAEALELFRRSGYLYGTAATLNNLGAIEQQRANPEAAGELYEEALALTRQLDARYGIAMSLTNLGVLECELQEYTAARARFTEALVICREIGDRDGIVSALTSAGCLLNAGGRLADSAVCLLGARHQAERLGLALDTGEGGQLARGLAVIEQPETGLPVEERARLKTEAEALSLDELVEFAQQALGRLELE
jgi:tetratricopeptide (TPR) repeat protein